MSLKNMVMSVSIFTLVLIFSSCATMNKLSTAQTDRLGSSPFYKSYLKFSMSDTTVIYHLPVDVSDRYKTDPFHKSRKNSLQPLLDAMASYIDSLQKIQKLEADQLSLPGAPRLFIGSSESFDAPSDAEMMRNENDKYPPMIIHIEKPSKEWKTVLTQSLTAVNGNYLLIMQLSFDDYPKADKGMFGKKVVLGTNYEQGLNFLTAIDKPVEVLQLTGMLLDLEGNILRAGSEGILAKDTPFSLQIFDIEKEIDKKAIDQLIENERRDDLPGQPLKWKVAVDNLLINLLKK
jgi:hypothetical protein